MRKTSRMHLTLAAVAVASAAYAPAIIGQQREEQAIRAAGMDWQRAIAARDVDKIVAIHAPDAVVMIPNVPLASGSSGIRSSYTELVNAPGLALAWVPTKIDVVSPTVATETGTYTIASGPPDARMNVAGNYTVIWRKIGGKWRVATDAVVNTTPLPMAGASSAEMGDTQMLANTGLAWADFSAPGFDPGTKIVVLHGDPSKKGDYTLRLQFPDGYKFPVHWHPGGEHLTVLSGTFLLGMGTTADWTGTTVRTYAPGDFIYLPAKHPHFGGVKGTTVVQLHGEGPFQLFLGAPK
jgi:uncharacterized protein (TIGR02246 family)